MRREDLDWLLAGPAWVRYAVQSQLLDIEPDARPVLEDEAVQRVLQRLKSRETGLPALSAGKVHYTDTGKAYWDLFFLADIGLTVKDLGLEPEAEEVFRFQLPDGNFRIPPNVQPDYVCMSAILLASLARMGYRDDIRVRDYVRAAMNSQLTNGGWDCYGDNYGHDSCPMDDMNVLMLLANYENQRENPALRNAIDHLLSHREEGRHLYGFGTGKRFHALQYPAVKYGILRVLDVLSLYPYAVDSRAFISMLDHVHGKERNGRYTPEAAEPVYKDFDFGQTNEPSRWLTFIINRIEKRAGVLHLPAA